MSKNIMLANWEAASKILYKMDRVVLVLTSSLVVMVRFPNFISWEMLLLIAFK